MAIEFLIPGGQLRSERIGGIPKVSKTRDSSGVQEALRGWGGGGGGTVVGVAGLEAAWTSGWVGTTGASAWVEVAGTSCSAGVLGGGGH